MLYCWGFQTGCRKCRTPRGRHYNRYPANLDLLRTRPVLHYLHVISLYFAILAEIRTNVRPVDEAEKIEKSHCRHNAEINLQSQFGLGLAVKLDRNFVVSHMSSINTRIKILFRKRFLMLGNLLFFLSSVPWTRLSITKCWRKSTKVSPSSSNYCKDSSL